MFFRVVLAAHPESYVTFNSDFITKIVETGDAVGINVVGSMAEIRIKKSVYAKFKHDLKIMDVESKK